MNPGNPQNIFQQSCMRPVNYICHKDFVLAVARLMQSDPGRGLLGYFDFTDLMVLIKAHGTEQKNASKP